MPVIRPSNRPDLEIIVDEEDYERCVEHTWSVNVGGYAATTKRVVGTKKLKHILMHRFIMKMEGPKPHLDHINGNKLDNRKENLREATIKENVWNRGVSRRSKSGYRGVTKCTLTDKWNASIMADGVRHMVGRFETAEDAAHAWDLKAIELYGEFAWLNFPGFDYSDYQSKDIRNNTSEFPGVHWCKLHKDWVACIYIDKQRHHIGRFKTELDAAKAVSTAMEQLCPHRLKMKRYAPLRELAV